MEAEQKDGAGPVGSRATVLVVDDEEALHDVVEMLLVDYRILHAYNGWQAIATVQRNEVDVVLMDLDLPDIPGFRLLDDLRASADPQVIVFTAHSDVQKAVRGRALGAFDFLVKTHDNYQHLAEHVERALISRKTRR